MKARPAQEQGRAREDMFHFALQQRLKQPLLKGQWHFIRLLCIGAAGMQGWEQRSTRASQKSRGRKHA
jgi:hypothetical protein